MRKLALKAEVREEVSKRSRKALRREGYIPGSVSGKGAESTSVMVAVDDFTKLTKEHNPHGIIVELSLAQDGKKKEVATLIREIHRDPITRKPLNIEFNLVRMDQPITTFIPVILLGEPVGLREGGILDVLAREVQIKCLPDQMPEHMELDINGVAIGEHLSVGHLTAPEGVEILSTPEDLVVAVRARKLEVVEEEEAPEEEVAPEEAEEGEEEKPKVEEPEGKEKES